ncbi:MAG TPA: APC family permease [Ktedonobacteraceae bacterium]|nr:APC family permease [Ktedonobacteraceae bacterium]
MATVDWAKPSVSVSEAESRRDVLLSEEYVVQAMPAILGTFDMTSTYLLIIFFITNATVAVSGGAAAFTYLILGGITFYIPCVIATAQLGVMFPYEGSLYNWTHKALGGYWSFFVAFCAWFPGVLVMISAGDALVAFIQGLNGNWLTQPWQQGLVICLIIIFYGVLAVQRYRTVQNVVNVAACLTFLGVAIIGLAGVVWLLQGHHSATSFNSFNDWSVQWNGPSANLSLFGLITLAYLGMEAPLNMGGEIRERRTITRHLLIGTVLVFVGYFIATFSTLVVMGPTNGAVPFALVSTVDTALGKFMGGITAVCIMSFFVVTGIVYNFTYARLLLVGGIDQRLPARVGRLNKHRVPGNAIIFQTMVAIALTLLVFLVVPLVGQFGNPVNLSIEVYNVMLASSTLVWAISTAFLFVNITRFYLRDREVFRKQLIFPMPVLWVSIVLGSVSCLLAIVGTLFFSWIPSLISNNQWWYIIGGLTAICLVIAGIGSMLASSEASWQGLRGIEPDEERER